MRKVTLNKPSFVKIRSLILLFLFLPLAARSAKPAAIAISFSYETAPINYTPAWTDETEYMNVLATMAEGAYPGYNFNIEFEGSTVTSYANIIAGIAVNTSYASVRHPVHHE